MIIVISDIHLSIHNQSITNKFLQFLGQHKPQQLYILGDLFDYWAGDDAISSYHLAIIDALSATVEKGIEVYFICGNRDFLIGKDFCKRTNLIALPDFYILEVYGKKRLLLHGDTLCTQDSAYMKFRSMVRNKAWQDDFLSKPVNQRMALIEEFRVKSSAYGKEHYGDVTDASQSAVNEVCKQYDVEQVIHGHTHRPKVQHHLLSNKRIVKQIVLGAWHRYSWHLQIDKSGEKLIAGYS